MFFSTIIGVLFFLRILKIKKKKTISYESLAMPMEGHELHTQKKALYALRDNCQVYG